MNVNKKVLTVTGIILLLINIIFFLTPLHKTLVMFLADVFIIIAALLMLEAFSLAFRKSNDHMVARSNFFGWPIMQSGINGFTASVLINVALVVVNQFLFVFPWIVIVFNAVLIAVVIIDLIVVGSSRDYVEQQRVSRVERMSSMKELRLQSRQLVDLCQNPQLRSRLDNLAKAFSYSDPNSNAYVAEIEAAIRTELNVLEAMSEANVEEAYAQADKIERLLKKRNSMVMAHK